MRLSSRSRANGRWFLPLLAALPLLTACPSTPPLPDPPTIDAFTADDTTITQGATTTLRWTVTNADTITLNDGSDDLTIPDGATTLDVTPTTTTTYTLTATNTGGSVDATTTITVVPPPAISGLDHEIISGSQVLLTWTVANASAVQVYAVTGGGDAQAIGVPLAGDAEETTFGIPVVARQTVRVCAESALYPDACTDTLLTNVVTTGADWDPYDLLGFVPDAPIPGSLRSLLLNAPAGSIIGFAADVDEVVVAGVDLINLSGGLVDAHLILRGDVTISGPASGVTLRGATGWTSGDPGDPFTWRSRLLLVAPGVTATLENLVLTGGTFIYKGGGIRNDGTLTVNDSAVEGNRAWDVGGGIWNTPTGVLEINDSEVSGNRAATEVAEVGTKYAIRGSADPVATICMSASGFGGGLFNEGVAVVRDTLFEDNEAVVSGGHVYNHPTGELTLEGASLVDGVADYEPYTTDPAFPTYPIFVGDADCRPDPLGEYPQFDAFAPFSLGGGIYQGNVLTFAGTEVQRNFVRDAGGGLYVEATSTSALLTNVLIDFNTAQFGGGILHAYFIGAPENLTLGAGVSYGTNANTPENLLENPLVPPTGFGQRAASPEALRGTYPETQHLRER